ncbi:MAG: metallopeptidase family protein [Oscillospiraceae bacterium]|jgi:hypothetical protein|nr:metallopeptidase family protein [Oscillospiraceae bacterium]
MFTFDEIGEMLDIVADEVPLEFYRDLNGGVSLLPDTKTHDQAIDGDLYILGDYHHDSLGRYIFIYYGSLMQVYPQLTAEEMSARLLKLLLHEFTHHLESLTGQHSLEDKDARDLDDYKRRSRRRDK